MDDEMKDKYIAAVHFLGEVEEQRGFTTCFSWIKGSPNPLELHIKTLKCYQPTYSQSKQDIPEKSQRMNGL